MRPRTGLALATRLALAAAGLLALGIPASAPAQEGAIPPHWIWAPSDRPNAETPAETRHFRKEFSVKETSRLALDATADNRFTLYLDGKAVVSGDDWRVAKPFQAQIPSGRHVLAAVVSNEAAGPAAFLLRGGVLPLGQGVPIHTNASWKSAPGAPADDSWTRPGFDDSAWPHAADLGVLGTAPWLGVTFESGEASDRFKVPAGFEVDMVADPKVTESVIAFTFDEKGRPVVSIERGPIGRLVDADGDGRFESKVTIAPGIKNCQGLSFIRGALYAVGEGPQKAGLYRLTDKDGDGVFESIQLVRATAGGMGEHGPHAVMLGPDGRLYYNNGNHAHLQAPIDPASPLNIFYEGELLPHYNDARGHAAGIMAPGGEIYRSDDDGATWKRIVGGFRNEYDFAFNRDGELFTFDSDMEWDIGLPWYRPVRVNHGILGAEFGWRNGSGKWPSWYFDSLPTTLDLGRGSPTGVTFYQGGTFPEEYDDNFLICDWSQGRILAVALTRQGATYAARASEFVTGQPLNCTDIEAGPDGAVYFSTGGRGTQGGLFRVRPAQAAPSAEPGDPIRQALRIGSPLSSFSQAKLAALKARAGEGWGEALRKLARTPAEAAADRVAALRLLVQFGPAPGVEALVALAKDENPKVRAEAIAQLGMKAGSGPAIAALTGALSDRDPFVRRRAVEGLMQAPSKEIPIARLLPLLADPDRWIRFSARVAIEHAGPERARDSILGAKAPRPLIEGMLALVRGTKLDEATQGDLLSRQRALLGTDLEPADRLDLLRLIEVTYLLGPKKADAPASAGIRKALLAAYPTRDLPTDRELARLLAYLDEPEAVEKILVHQAAMASLEGDPARSRPEQIHDAYCLRAMKNGWTPESKRQLWAWYETASHWDGGFSFLGYLDFMVQELVGLMGAGERGDFLALGATYPFPTRVLVRSLDLDARPEGVAALASLYTQLAEGTATGSAGELQAIILETLGRSRSRAAHAALRALVAQDSSRRDVIARHLAVHPEAADLPSLVDALRTRDPNTASAVLAALRNIPASPEGPEGLRNLLQLARRVGPPSRKALDELASRWTGAKPAGAPGDFGASLAAWERVYRERFPQGPALAETSAAEERKYTLAELVRGVLESEPIRKASPARGREVITRARCLDCHKFGDQGQGLGPDLTTVSSRFRNHEILESIVAPSKEVSDQYRSVSVATADGKVFTGMPVVNDGPNLVLLLSDGTRQTIPKDDIEERMESKSSVMPEGLLNPLDLQQIADLLALFNSMPRVEAPAAGGSK